MIVLLLHADVYLWFFIVYIQKIALAEENCLFIYLPLRRKYFNYEDC